MNACAPTVLLVLVCSSMHASAACLPGGGKTPRPLPVMQDVKTPEPPHLTGPGLALSVPATNHAPSTSRPALDVPANVLHQGRHEIDRVLTSVDEDGLIWARGRQYKARFGTDGATYVPFFGSKAPRNHPVTFTTSSVHVGATNIECNVVAPVCAGETVSFARGGLVERWQLGVGGMEQQFQFDTLPSSGDLVIRIDAPTDLSASIAGGTIAFSDELGRVDYGVAVAIDATGQRFPLTSSLSETGFANESGDGIELRLTRHDLVHATLPIVVDPFVSTFAVDSFGTQGILPDVAYEAGTDRYLVVYEDIYSGTDHDVYAELRDASGGLVVWDYIDYTTDYWATPRVASNYIAQNFMCVAAVGLPSSVREIWGRTFDASTGVMGSQTEIAGFDFEDKFQPDIGGDSSALPPTYYMVVWERGYSPYDHDVHGRLVGADGTLQGATAILVDNSIFTIDTHPAIAKCDGNGPFATQVWTIVWQRFDTAGQHDQIFGTQISWDAQLLSPTFPIDATGDITQNPRVSSILDGDGITRPYMVVFQNLSQQGDWDITAAMFEGSTFLTATDIADQVDFATGSREQVSPSIDSDGDHFTVAYSELDPSTSNDWNVIAADLVYAGDYAYVCESAVLGSSPDSDVDSSITSTNSGGGARQRFLVAWAQTNYQLGTAEIAGALYDGCQGGFTEPFCFGDGTATGCPCGNVGAAGNGCANSVDANGGKLTSTGNPWVSADTLVLQASGLPPGAAALYFQGQPPAGGYFGAVFGDGIRCIAQQIRRIGTKPNPAGSSEYPEGSDPLVSVKGFIPANGGEAFYQVWYRNAGAFCMPSTFNLTNGLRVVWAP